MELNEKIKILWVLFRKYAPDGATLLDFIKQDDEFIILYQDDKNRNIIQHLSSNGLYSGRYYANYLAAFLDFSDIK